MAMGADSITYRKLRHYVTLRVTFHAISLRFWHGMDIALISTSHIFNNQMEQTWTKLKHSKAAPGPYSEKIPAACGLQNFTAAVAALSTRCAAMTTALRANICALSISTRNHARANPNPVHHQRRPPRGACHFTYSEVLNHGSIYIH